MDNFAALDTAVTLLGGFLAGRLLGSGVHVVEVEVPTIVEIPTIAHEICQPGVLESLAERLSSLSEDLQDRPWATGTLIFASYHLLLSAAKCFCRRRPRRTAVTRYVGSREAPRPALLG